MTQSLSDHRILFFVGDIYEDLELWYPLYRLQAAGAETVVAGEEMKEFSGKHGYPASAECLVDDLRTEDFTGLVIPGGFMPDKLRRNPKILELTREFDEANKMIGMICHAGWIPISAGIVKGRRVTSTPGIKDDLTNAGAKWIDEAVVWDQNLISARRPPDLPAFGEALVEFLTS
ncbi:type 1 glutamine amidotransferase domain-containing protein [Puniceicoccus vermicola]|uniref:Type 1 glutamine amidotransferase n=1 Tax=Puniceicoccus vermicola TaxID=388746 RepID=A0A7X1E3A8_9BACT|nr:type 1 glutamine amidotransferase domain-containing protein [Puniceicoccus vermicola]MBC2600783.1 type 1 glutamine amidotransferase [Puniceicoccus vermicola]